MKNLRFFGTYGSDKEYYKFPLVWRLIAIKIGTIYFCEIPLDKSANV